MIDWFNLFANSLWILGCSLALGTLSYASWEASTYQEKMRERLKRSAMQISMNLAGFLFCTGLAATSDKTIEIVLWVVLALLFVAQVVVAIIQKKKRKETL